MRRRDAVARSRPRRRCRRRSASLVCRRWTARSTRKSCTYVERRLAEHAHAAAAPACARWRPRRAPPRRARSARARRTPRPALEALDDGIGVRQVIGDGVGGLRRARVDDEVARRQRRQRRAAAPHQPQREIEVRQRRAGGDERARTRTTMRDSSSSTRGKRSRNSGASHQVVVAARPSRSAVCGEHEGAGAGRGQRAPRLRPARRQRHRVGDVGAVPAPPSAPAGVLQPSAGTITTSGRAPRRPASPAPQALAACARCARRPTTRDSKRAGLPDSAPARWRCRACRAAPTGRCRRRRRARARRPHGKNDIIIVDSCQWLRGAPPTPIVALDPCEVDRDGSSSGLLGAAQAKPGKEAEVAELPRERVGAGQPGGVRRRCGSPCGSARRRSACSTHSPTRTAARRISNGPIAQALMAKARRAAGAAAEDRAGWTSSAPSCPPDGRRGRDAHRRVAYLVAPVLGSPAERGFDENNARDLCRPLHRRRQLRRGARAHGNAGLVCRGDVARPATARRPVPAGSRRSRRSRIAATCSISTSTRGTGARRRSTASISSRWR